MLFDELVSQVIAELFPETASRRKKRRPGGTDQQLAELIRLLRETAAQNAAQHHQAPPVVPTSDFARRAAAMLLSAHSGVPASLILDNGLARKRAYREASKKLHPDSGGSSAEFQELQLANSILEGKVQA